MDTNLDTYATQRALCMLQSPGVEKLVSSWGAVRRRGGFFHVPGLEAPRALVVQRAMCTLVRLDVRGWRVFRVPGLGEAGKTKICLRQNPAGWKRISPMSGGWGEVLS